MHLPETKKKNLAAMLPSAPEDAIDLIDKLLQFNPTKRLTAKQALNHPFVAKFHDPKKEYDCGTRIKMPILFDDDLKCSCREYRDKLFGDVRD